MQHMQYCEVISATICMDSEGRITSMFNDDHPKLSITYSTRFPYMLNSKANTSPEWIGMVYNVICNVTYIAGLFVCAGQ